MMTEQKAQTRQRVWRNLAQGWVVLPVLFLIFYFSDEGLALVSKGGEVVHSMPVETIQGIFLAFLYVGSGARFAHLMTSLTERMFRPNAFGSACSRYAVIWLAFFLSFSLVAAAIL